MRRYLPLCSLLFLPTLSQAQTKPDKPVPLESKVESRALVQKLLREGKIMRAQDAKRGQKGVAYSVFQGTKIEKFDVVVLGTLERGQGGGDLVLIKVVSGPVVARQSGIIQGMSGSPVYINGKLLGAIAIGFGFPKEPIGGVTPITQMISGALPDNAPLKPSIQIAKSEIYRPKSPLTIRNRRIARLEVTRDASLPAFSGSMNAATMRMRPATQMLLLSGISEAGLGRWKSMLAPYGITPVMGGGAMIRNQVFGMPGKKGGIAASLAPGAAIGVQLASGDIDATGVGTVTYRIGNRVLAFGHPMFNLGAVSMPMTTAYVHDIFPAFDISFKLASPIKSVGELQQDTNFAIGGTVGRQAQTVPLRISLVDVAKKINRKYNVRLIKDPVFTPQIAQSIAVDALSSSLGLDSGKMVRVSFAMGLKNGAAIRRTNTVYAADQVVAGALGEMLDALSITQANPYEKGNISSLDLKVEVVGKRRTARIRRVYADKNRLKAGESAQISVVLEPTGEPDNQITKRFTVRVPDDAPSGVLRIAASSGGDIFAARQRVGGEPPRPGNFRELLSAYAQIGANNELLLQTSTPRRFLLIDRKRVSNPPPSWNRLVPSGPSSAVVPFNETQTQRQASEYVLTGLESISIPVESRRESDKTRPDAPVSDEGSPTVVSSNDTPNSISSSGSGGDNDFVARLPTLLELDAAPDWKPRWKQLSRILMQIPLPKPAPPVPTEPQIAPTPQPGTLLNPGAAPIAGAAPTVTPTPTPAPAIESGAANIARPVGRFIQKTSADFAHGQFDGVVVENDGTLRVGPKSRRLYSSPEPLAWSIASNGKGVTYLGTGNSARLLRIENGVSKVIYEGPEVAVSALALDPNGILYAGVSPGGRVLRFNPDGTHSVVLNTGQTFIHALQFAPNGDLIVATGGESAKIYRISTKIPLLGDLPNLGDIFRSRPQPPKSAFATLPQKHARSLAIAGDSIFVGTGDDATLYRIDANGQTTALYQAAGAGSGASPPAPMESGPTVIVAPGAPDGASSGAPVFFSSPSGGDASGRGNEISALAASGQDVYFGTLNSGTIYRWSAQNGVQTLFKTPGSAIYGLQMLGDSLYAATGEGGEVWRVANLGGDVVGARVLDATQPQVLALSGANGKIFAATANNAAVYEIGGAGQNTFLSNVFDAGQIVKFGGLTAISSGATFDFRAGNTLEPDATWSTWNAANTQNLGTNSARYAQYRVHLADGGSVSRVEIAFRAPNHAPRVSFVSPGGGDYFSGKKTLNWSGTDPDKDPLRYKLELIGEGKKAQIVELTSVTASSQEVDTKKYPDGIYTAKITASDASRNAQDPQSDTAISLPFTLDNSAPVAEKPVVNRDGTAWNFTLSATDALSPLAGAEWRVAVKTDAKTADKTAIKIETKPALTKSGKTQAQTKNAKTKVEPKVEPKVEIKTEVKTEDKPGEWQAAAPSDGFFDAKTETITARLDPDVAGIALKSGDTIEIRVRDAAGNATTSKIILP